MRAASVTRGGAVAQIGPDGDLTFSGYASLFNVADLSGDMLLPGAFRRSIGRRGALGIKMLYQHDPTIILGQWLQIEEDAKGLKVTGQFASGVAKAVEVMSLVQAGILDGLSIGFRTVSARTDAKSGIRRVAEVDLWEVSIVTFPMLPGARITASGGEAKGQSLTESFSKAARHLRAEAGRGDARDGARGRVPMGRLAVASRGWTPHLSP
ncbi:HK97 family phage prohead protease [Oryzibacter oryziterrae]|uniref:HK97 family phage prohead protease n=1 Tax=Oryzibacter oryziterrae TaxID=2766474 RepID=UPI001F02391E|nr:HK97 family phage prohead protease [Oryzibacter oryziterrae]